jgi:hypothetical protein
MFTYNYQDITMSVEDNEESDNFLDLELLIDI